MYAARRARGTVGPAARSARADTNTRGNEPMADGGFRIDGVTVSGAMVDALGHHTLAASLDAIAEQVRLMVGAHQSAVSYIPDGDFTRACHATSLSEKYAKYRTYDVMPTGRGIWAVIFEKRQPMRLTEAELHAHHRFKNFSDLKDKRGLEHPPMPGWLAVPAIRPNGEAIGVLQLSDKLEGDFTQQDEDLMCRLASMVSAMFEAEYVKEQLVATQLELRARTEELEHSNQELEQFAYVASHDLQEPLRKVSNFTRLLRELYGDQLDEAGNQYLDHAHEGAERMSVLIADLLAFSRVGTQESVVTPVDLGAVVDGVTEALSLQLTETGGRVTRDPLPTLDGDRVQLEQVFMNLIGNGLKFHGDSPPRVHVAAEQVGDRWHVTVRDNGIGIAPGHHGRIFQMFQRLHRREEYRGTGIGLAIVLKVVRRHGGTISLESQLGEGTTFTLSLPAGDSTNSEDAT